MKLYEIDRGIRAVLEMIEIDEETGEVFGDLGSLEELQFDAEQQMESIGCYIKELEIECSGFEEAIKSMKTRMIAKKNKAARLKDYLARFSLAYLDSTGKKAFETPNVSLSFRSSTALECDEEAFDEAKALGLITTKIEENIDAAAVKDYIKAGNTFDHARIVSRKNIQIK